MSQFLRQDGTYTAESLPEIDFDNAVKLPEGGSTCDIYRTKWQRRDVFVKRLKEEYRTKPLYLDALDKEYDIGVSLKHPSLPEYREFHRDYIVMDYIDGQTLAEMIRRKDPWLSNGGHIVAILRQLVDVVDYLHRHNVVHCDIKPDNIMITSNSKNLVLIDFDKCYTDALNDTSGHPGKFGLTIDEAGRVSIDFHGIANLVERIKVAIPGFSFHKYGEFVKACNRPDVNCEELSAILVNHESSSDRLALFVGGGMLLLGLLIGFVGYMFDRMDEQKYEQAINENISDTVAEDSLEIVTIAQQDLPDGSNASESSGKTQDEIHADAKQKAAILDERIKPGFDRLQSSLDNLASLMNDTTLTGQQLLDSIRAHADMEDEYLSEAFAILNELFPGSTDKEAWRIMAYSKAYTGYTRRFSPLGKEYRQEYERRFMAEGSTPK